MDWNGYTSDTFDYSESFNNSRYSFKIPLALTKPFKQAQIYEKST